MSNQMKRDDSENAARITLTLGSSGSPKAGPLADLVMCEGQPPVDGLYVAYVNADHYSLYADKRLLMFLRGKWGYPSSIENYRGHVYGWIGPIPALQLEDA